jgi:3-deoxy-D-manno-octulosonate 8-phosphate phosphatase (KDO 8-P phosphatase)
LPSDLDDHFARIGLVAFDVDGTLTDGRIGMDADGLDSVAFHVRDGLAIRLLLDQGIPVAFISGRESRAALARAKKLGLTHAHTGAKDKPALMRKIAEEEGVELENVLFAGDDLPDLPVMSIVGMPVATADADPQVKARARFVTEHAGGAGVARELAERLLRARGAWDRATARFTEPPA